MKSRDLYILLTVIAVSLLVLFSIEDVLAKTMVQLVLTGLYFGVFMLSIGSVDRTKKPIIGFVSKTYLYVLLIHIVVVGLTFSTNIDFSFYMLLLTLIEAILLSLAITVFRKRERDTIRLYTVFGILIGSLILVFYFYPDFTQYQVLSERSLRYTIYVIDIILYLLFIGVAVYKEETFSYLDYKWLVLLGTTRILSFMLGIVLMDASYIDLVYNVIYLCSGIVLFYALYSSSILVPYNQTVKDLEESKQTVENLLRVDQLTGLANRTHLFDSVDKLFRLSKREKHPISFIMIDIDDFREFNEGYGQNKGDVLLQRVASVLEKACMRPLDIVGRYGGEEFLVCLPNSDLEGTTVVCKRIKQMIRAQAMAHPYRDEKYLSLSMGFVTIIPTQKDHYKNVILESEEVMMKIKRTGKNDYMGKDLNKERNHE